MTESTITAFLAAIAASFGAFNILVQKRSEAKKLAAIETVKQDQIVALEANRLRLQGIIVTLGRMHSDGNSAMGNVLRLLAQTQRRLSVDSNDPLDKKLAAQFEARADAHDAVQSEIDARQAMAKAELVELERQSGK